MFRRRAWRHREVEGHSKVSQQVAEPELNPSPSGYRPLASPLPRRKPRLNGGCRGPCLGYPAAPGAHEALFLAEAGAAAVTGSRPSAESAMRHISTKATGRVATWPQGSADDQSRPIPLAACPPSRLHPGALRSSLSQSLPSSPHPGGGIVPGPPRQGVSAHPIHHKNTQQQDSPARE